jgi:uncharacterized repeat protein (TIGR01451 family)
MNLRRIFRWCAWLTLCAGALVLGHPFPGTWDNGAGTAIHYQPVLWPSEPSDPTQCGDSCGSWKPYTRFNRSINDQRVQDPSNGGTAPQNYVNVSSSCSDNSKPSIYYYLHQGATQADDVIMFRWRVEQPAHNYATGSNPGNYGATSPWSSAQWTVLFDLNGTGYRTLAAHLNGSSGSPAEPIDMLAGIWSNTNNQSIDYTQPGVTLLAHNPTAFIGPTNKLMNFHGTLNPNESWPNGSSETNWDYGTTRAKTITTSPCGEYFIDYQIPVAMLDATGNGGPRITRDTPISMLFCTANSLSNPFQKDCAVNRQWTADATQPAPFGDYLSFNKTEPYQQPIVSSVTATAPQSCPGSYTLTAKIQDALAVQSGAIVPTIKSAQFYYWYDSNGDGDATASDTGSVWTRITPAASQVSGTLNTFTASWNASSLSKGKYLIGVQAVDDNTLLDDNMTASGVDNRTFSYLGGDADNKIYIAGTWKPGQQSAFPTHSPSQSPSSSENWFGNPTVTGIQTAVIGVAINACGVAPTLTLAASPSNVAAGGTVGFTATVTNPSSNSGPIAVDVMSVTLPSGFSYTNTTTSGTGGLPSTDPTISSQQLTWTLSSPISVNPSQSATLTFNTTASSTAGNYSAVAQSTTSFGNLTSNTALVAVDSARLSLSMTPSTYSIAADGSTQLVYTLRYANDSSVPVTSATISDVLPAGVTYVSCSGGSSCSNASGTVTWSLGSLGAGASGTVTLTITVPGSYNSFSLSNSATLSATAPDSSTVTKNASVTVAVSGVSLPGTPAFTLTKTANVTTVAPGGSVTYTITYNNYGTGSASSVVITDPLPSGITYSSCTGSCSNSSNNITWNIGTVAAGASASLTVTGTVGSPFTASNPAVNTASINWSGGSAVTASVAVGVTGQSCSTYYFRNTTANVGFDGTKRVATGSPVPLVTDTGTTVSATAPVSGSAFLEVLRFYQDPKTENDVPFDGNITSNIYIDRSNGQGLNIRATVYDYNSTSGATTQLGQTTTLFNGSTKGLLTVTVTPSGTLLKGHRLLWVYDARSNHGGQTVDVEFQFAGTVTNGISGGTTFANSNATYCITPPASLTLTSQVSSASITEATTPTLTYTLKYANAGSANATSTSLISALPSNFTSCQYSTDNSSWNTCSTDTGASRSHTFSLGTIGGGGTGTVYVRGIAPSTAAPATLTSTSSISSDQTSSLNATASTSVVAAGGGGGSPALTLVMTADKSSATPSSSVVYTLTVINSGSAAATNVAVTDTVPANAYYTYASCTGGCGVSTNTLTWPTIASLAAGASQSYTYTMNVAGSGLPAGVTVINDDASASGDGGLTATSNTISIAINGNPSLVLTNVASPTVSLVPGSTITYTLTVANSGSATASDIVVSNPIPANTSFKGSITASQGSGSFDTINNRMLFNVGTLASGASATLSYAVTINSPLNSGNTTITSTATADANNAAQQITAVSVTASAAPVLAVTKSIPSSVTYPSATLTATANGTTLFVDRTDRFHVNQLIKVGSSVARITALSAQTLLVDTTITASSGTAVNGSIPISIAYRNTGNANATSATIQEPLGAGLGYYSSTPTATTSPSTGSSGTVSWNLGTVAAGASGTLQLLAFPTGTTGSFTQVTPFVASNATTATATSTTVIGGLSVTKTSSTPIASAGGNASYTIVITNSLGSVVNSVSVTDALPQGMTYLTNSATVGSTLTEPTFDGNDTAHTQPTWSGLTIAANGSLSIQFQTSIAATVGAGAYQNEVDVTPPTGVGITEFDPLLTTAEDVTVLAAASGVLKGYVFNRPSGNTPNFDPLSDIPLSGVRVELHKASADCNAPVGGNCVVVYTDSNGYFEHVMAAEDWIVSVIENTGDLPSGWFQLSGSNDNTVSVPDQASITDHNGFSSTAPTTYTVSTSVGTNGSVSPTSRTVNDGDTTTFTITPNANYAINSVSGCSGSLSASTYTTGTITADCTVTASFNAITHTVTATAGSGGNIGPASAVVNQGSTTAFTVTPNSGFSIASVSGCSGSLVGNTYTTAAITTACTVSATFVSNSVPTHTVTAVAGTGGSISPSSILVADTTTTSLTVIADSGFGIANVTGCGGTLSGNTYTTAPITAACTVTASFAASSSSSSSAASSSSSSASSSASNSSSSSSASSSSSSGSGPLFDPAPPVSINATALFTDVPLNIAPRAIDGNGNTLTVTLVGVTKLRSGRHVLTWSATDGQGNTITTTQQLDILPIVSVSEDFSIGFGNSAQFKVILNGDAPTYPYTVNFTIGGDGGYGSLHNLASGSVTFSNGTEQAISFDALPQGTSMPTKQLTVTLDPAVNRGERYALKIDLISVNAAPSVEIVVTQQGRVGTLIAKDGGVVTLHASVDDPNKLDTHTFEWSYPSSASVQLTSNGRDLTVDAAALATGLQDFSVTVTDSGSPPLNNRSATTLAVRASSLVLTTTDSNGNGTPDDQEGWGDNVNGIPLYLARTHKPEVLPEDLPVTDQYLIEGDPGVTLRIGGYSQLVSQGARLQSIGSINSISNDVVKNVGGIFDLAAVNLAQSGSSVRAVIPQRAPIPSDAIYRLWDNTTNQWVSFVESANNNLSSAPGEPGYCPPPGSTAYTPGLTAGNLCVQVTIEDGGPNDRDRKRTASLSFTGGVGQQQSSVVVGSSSGGSGGGSMGWSVLLLLAFALLYRVHTVRRFRLMQTAAIAAASIALAPISQAEDNTSNAQPCLENGQHCYYGGASIGLIHNNSGASDMDNRLAAQGYTTHTTLTGQTRLDGSIHFGYRWEHIATELTYAYLGRMDTRVEGLTPVDQPYLHAISLAHPRSGEGPQANVLGYWPLKKDWELFGRVGLFYWRNTQTAEGFSRYADNKDRTFDLFYGVGLQFPTIRRRWLPRAEFQLYKLDGETLTSINATISYRFDWKHRPERRGH